MNTTKSLWFRFQIKDYALLQKVLDRFEMFGFKITVNNMNGNCLYINITGMEVWHSHWTTDNEYEQINDGNYKKRIMDIISVKKEFIL